MSLLAAEGIVGGYGGLNILNGLDLVLAAGEIVVIVGANGAGKSTAMKSLFGLVQLSSGSVTFDDQVVTNVAPERLVSMGLGYVPQERNIFGSMTVNENLEMGGYTRRDGGLRAAIARIYDLFPPLRDRRTQPAAQLSGGQRQMVAFGRALVTDPKVLMLDEPTAGLSPLYMSEIFDCINTVNATGVSILMVEQNARQALELCDRGYVLANGRNLYTDTGANLLADENVVNSFLGGSHMNDASD